MVLSTDAADIAVGAVLYQEGKPLGYYSRKFSGSEKNYSAFDKGVICHIPINEKFRTHAGGLPYDSAYRS